MLPIIRATPASRNSGKLDAEEEGLISGVLGVEGAECRLREECVGASAARVEEWWCDLVSRREMEAVAVDVPEDATGMGERGRNTGCFICAGTIEDFLSSTTGAGCSSKILRRLWTVRYAWGWSDELDDDEDAESSSMGGVIGRMAGAGGGDCAVGVMDCDREPEPRRLKPRSVLVLAGLLEPRRLLNEKPEGFGGVFSGAHVGCCVTNDESRLYAGVEGSIGLSVNTGRDADADV